MPTQSERTTQDYIDAFNRRMAELAAYQQEVCFQLAAERLQQDIEAMHRPPPPHPVVRVGYWIGRQVIVHAEALGRLVAQERRRPLFASQEELPHEDEVFIVDAEYHVVDVDTGDSPAILFDKQEGDSLWDR